MEAFKKFPVVSVHKYRDDEIFITVITKNNRWVVKAKTPNYQTVECIKNLILTDDIPNAEKEEIISNLGSLDTNSDISHIALSLPGMNQIVKHPIDKTDNTLLFTIINLNDNHQWSRDAIADWIEALDDVPTFGGVNEGSSVTLVAREQRI